MAILVTLAVTAGLLVAFEAGWFPPPWLRSIAGRHEPPGPAEGGESAMELGLFTWPLVRRRLDALAAELARLDGDPDVFAKAFHTKAARAAYEALLAEAARMTAQPPRPTAGRVDVQLVRPTTGQREELEL
jgi:hypothetical protein